MGELVFNTLAEWPLCRILVFYLKPHERRQCGRTCLSEVSKSEAGNNKSRIKNGVNIPLVLLTLW